MDLAWLPAREDFDELLRSLKGLPADQAAPVLQTLANSRMDFVQMGKLDRVLGRFSAAAGQNVIPGFEHVRLAILGSATTSHLAPGIRVAGLRRGLQIEVYEAPYGMYWQELMDTSSALYRFQPEIVLLALDARHLAGATGSSVDSAMEIVHSCWRQVRTELGCQVLQQTVLPVFPNLLGDNEQRLPQSPAAIVAGINTRLRAETSAAGIDLLALDTFAQAAGLEFWHQPDIWYRSKHEVHPRATAIYGDHVARLVAANLGRSAKCLVLDLDNTLWGGVIGDDGLNGIVLGQGSGTGEAFVDFQRYALGLSERGVILAVCSKNDEKNALEPFERHPEMVLKRGHIGCFVANWTDKAANLRYIAKSLNIGLDALVFADDNPVERALVRKELPMVHVPELPEDPAGYISTISAAGYFEGLTITEEDRARSGHYQANAQRECLKESLTDMGSYLESLRMTMTAQPFDAMGLARVTQLMNKTNQFNLTTRRHTEAEVAAIMRDPRVATLQVRLVDRFGDNGIIAVIVARVNGADAVIEDWLMSCRVLGRGVETACLNVMAERVAEMGAKRLVGTYLPTAKNGLVREMYPGLGFEPAGEDLEGATRWNLNLAAFVPRPVPMQVDVPHLTAATH